MHIEVQVALNFVISYLYNKLPRRRVNIFGEELERAMEDKFAGHWYPDKPYKGSAFRCIKTGSDPIDMVLARAAYESGLGIQDILENLPQDLAVWVDPGEVSYRIGEKGAIKVLFSEKTDLPDDRWADREVTSTFNPEAQSFRPIDAVSTSFNQMSLQSASDSLRDIQHLFGNASGHIPSTSSGLTSSTTPSYLQHNSHIFGNNNHSCSPSPIGSRFKDGCSPTSPPVGAVVPPFIPRSTAPLTFTTASFAQTKFGSTKLKTSSKRTNRMSPTEFSKYIKQRGMQQQIQHLSPVGSGRALSPDATSYFFGRHGSASSCSSSGSSNNGVFGGSINNVRSTSNAYYDSTQHHAHRNIHGGNHHINGAHAQQHNRHIGQNYSGFNDPQQNIFNYQYWGNTNNQNNNQQYNGGLTNSGYQQQHQLFGNGNNIGSRFGNGVGNDMGAVSNLANDLLQTFGNQITDGTNNLELDLDSLSFFSAFNEELTNSGLTTTMENHGLLSAGNTEDLNTLSPLNMANMNGSTGNGSNGSSLWAGTPAAATPTESNTGGAGGVTSGEQTPTTPSPNSATPPTTENGWSYPKSVSGQYQHLLVAN